MKSTKQIRNTVIILSVIFLGFILGKISNNWVKSEVTVNLDNEEYTSNGENGEKLGILEKHGIVYLPVNKNGSYLDYMTVEKDGELYLYKRERPKKFLDGFETETIKGEKVDNSIFNKANINIVFLWSTTCPACADVIEELKDKESYFLENNIPIFSIVTNKLSYNNLDDVDLEKVEVLDKLNGLETEVFIKDEVIYDKLLKGSITIPKMYIVDALGNTLKILEGVKVDELIEILDIIKER